MYNIIYGTSIYRWRARPLVEDRKKRDEDDDDDDTYRSGKTSATWYVLYTYRSVYLSYTHTIRFRLDLSAAVYYFDYNIYL